MKEGKKSFFASKSLLPGHHQKQLAKKQCHPGPATECCTKVCSPGLRPPAWNRTELGPARHLGHHLGQEMLGGAPYLCHLQTRNNQHIVNTTGTTPLGKWGPSDSGKATIQIWWKPRLCPRPGERHSLELSILYILKTPVRDFPGGPVAKTPRSQCRGPGFDPWSGN